MIKIFNPPARRTIIFPPACLDIETAPNGKVLDIGFAYWNGHKVIYEVYQTWIDFLNHFADLVKVRQQRKYIKNIYAHNGCGFDWLSLIDTVTKNKMIDKLTIIPSGSSAIGINLTIADTTYNLRDSMKLFAGTSLANVAKSFKVEVQKEDVPEYFKSRMDEYKKVHYEKYHAYLKADVIALQQSLEKFHKLVFELGGDVGELPMTLPSLALRLWRKTLDSDIMTPSDEKLKIFERRAYSGGRTECYRPYKGKVKIYDANSLYPTVMDKNKYPSSFIGSWVTEYSGEYGIYEIEYSQPKSKYKPLLRDESTNKFLYNGRGVFTHVEIDKLLQMGGTFKLVKGYEFLKSDKIFETFIKKWYGIRLKAQGIGDSAIEYICKILMNSLYGKTAQREEGERIEKIPAELVTEYLEMGFELRPLGDYFIIVDKREVEHTFCSIAAYVTANSRLELYNKMCLVVDSGNVLVAVDTDSIHVGCDEKNFEMETGKELGQWKLEFDGDGVYLGKKMYALSNGVIKAKGIGKTGRSKLTYEIMCDIYDNLIAEYGVTYLTPPTVKEVLSGLKDACVFYERKRTIKITAEDTSTW